MIPDWMSSFVLWLAGVEAGAILVFFWVSFYKVYDPYKENYFEDSDLEVSE